MSFHDTIRTVALVGMKYEAEDIIDYIQIRGSLLVSILIGAVLAIWVGRAVEPSAGALAGAGSYALSIRVCTLVFSRYRHQR
jgi:hypothetical protein